MSSELSSFIKEALAKGLKKEAITKALLSAGWRKEEVQDALSLFANVDFPVPVPRPKPYLQAREAFFIPYLFYYLIHHGLCFWHPYIPVY